jgi:hypothetical protein
MLMGPRTNTIDPYADPYLPDPPTTEPDAIDEEDAKDDENGDEAA